MKRRNHRGRSRFIAPMLCKPVQTLPEGGGWFYEVNRNGHPALVVKDGAKVTLFSREGKPLDYPEAEKAVRRLKTTSAVIDCEIIALNSEDKPCCGSPDTIRGSTIRLYAFDLLHLNGRDLMHEPIERRKEHLCTITLDSALLFSPSLNCEPEMLIEQVAQLSIEGVIAKRSGSTYEPGKCSGTWMKMRVARKAEVFVVGFDPGGALDPHTIGSRGRGKRSKPHARPTIKAGKLRALLT